MEKEDWLDIKDYSLMSKDMADLMVKESELGLKAKIDSLQIITDRADKLMTIYISICTVLGIYTLRGLIGLIKLKYLFGDYLLFTSLLCLLTALVGGVFCWFNIKKYTVGDLGESPNIIMRSIYVDNLLDEKTKYISLCVAMCRNIQGRMNLNDITIGKRSKNNQWSLRMLFFIALCPLISLIIFFLLNRNL